MARTKRTAAAAQLSAPIDPNTFTPSSLAGIDGSPVFTLRTIGRADLRHHRRLMVEEGLRHHEVASIRAEILTGLQTLWSPDVFAKHAPVLREYWQACDRFADALSNDPDAAWTYDSDVERAVADLTERVTEGWLPLRRMVAQIADFAETAPLIAVAIAVRSWASLDVPVDRDRGYLTIETAQAIRDALHAIDEQRGQVLGASWLALIVAASNRMFPSPIAAPPMPARRNDEAVIVSQSEEII